MNNEIKREMTLLEKVQMGLSFASPVFVFLFFIIIFVFLVKFDKNGFYPSYDLIKHNYALLQEENYNYDKNTPVPDLISLINDKKVMIEKNSDIYNEKLGILKNKGMIDLRSIYNNYILKLNEINKNARHGKYLSKEEYQDIIELLPTENQMHKINESLPKPFFLTFIKSVFFAVLIQFILYNVIVQPLKLITKKKTL